MSLVLFQWTLHYIAVTFNFAFQRDGTFSKIIWSQAEKQAADERARQQEIDAAYRAAIPDEVTAKVNLALEQQLPELRVHLEKKMQEREQVLLAKLAALQVH